MDTDGQVVTLRWLCERPCWAWHEVGGDEIVATMMGVRIAGACERMANKMIHSFSYKAIDEMRFQTSRLVIGTPSRIVEKPKVNKPSLIS